jgi:hypothetical protein
VYVSGGDLESFLPVELRLKAISREAQVEFEHFELPDATFDFRLMFESIDDNFTATRVSYRDVMKAWWKAKNHANDRDIVDFDWLEERIDQLYSTAN